jgi:hypothetical protein
MPILSGQFTAIYLANAAGTLTDISPYIVSVEVQRGSDSTDLTTFASGGGPVTITVIRGAATSEFTLKGLYDPAFAKIVRQIVAARSGFAVQIRSGSNAAPGQGDELYSGTFTCLNYSLAYNTGAVATVDLDLKPADGSAAPTFSTI